MKNFGQQGMLSRRAKETSLLQLCALEQFTRHTFAQRTNDDERCVKVFNRTVENFVEKKLRQTESARQHWAQSSLHNFRAELAARIFLGNVSPVDAVIPREKELWRNICRRNCKKLLSTSEAAARA